MPRRDPGHRRRLGSGNCIRSSGRRGGEKKDPFRFHWPAAKKSFFFLSGHWEWKEGTVLRPMPISKHFWKIRIVREIGFGANWTRLSFFFLLKTQAGQPACPDYDGWERNFPCFPFGLRGKIELPRGILVLILLLCLNSLAYRSFPHREYDYELYWSFSNKGGRERKRFLLNSYIFLGENSGKNCPWQGQLLIRRPPPSRQERDHPKIHLWRNFQKILLSSSLWENALMTRGYQKRPSSRSSSNTGIFPSSFVSDSRIKP